MKPLPLVWNGRPVPPAPPPYGGPGLAPPLAERPAPAAVEARRAPAEAYRRLQDLYRELDAEIAALAPRCDGRGICCDFDVVDHVLFASKLEMDLVKDALPPERYRTASGNRCPLLVDGRCGARDVRMLGCRTYFCQEGWEPRGNELYERYYARIKEIARDLDLDWRYAPALGQLRE